METFRLRVDYINRMLVSLNVPDDIVNSMSSLYDQLNDLQNTSDSPELVRRRGRPKFDIGKEQLSFLLDQGFSVPKISEILRVGNFFYKFLKKLFQFF